MARKSARDILEERKKREAQKATSNTSKATQVKSETKTKVTKPDVKTLPKVKSAAIKPNDTETEATAKVSKAVPSLNKDNYNKAKILNRVKDEFQNISDSFGRSKAEGLVGRENTLSMKDYVKEQKMLSDASQKYGLTDSETKRLYRNVQKQADVERKVEEAKKNRIKGTLGAVGDEATAKVLGIPNAIADVINNAKGEKVTANDESHYHKNAADKVRSAISDTIKTDSGKTAYNVTNSVLDLAAQLGLAGLANPIGQAGGNLVANLGSLLNAGGEVERNMIKNLENGADVNKAAGAALTRGATQFVLDKAGLKGKDITSKADLAKQVLKTAGVEGGLNALQEGLGIATDRAILGRDSDYSTIYHNVLDEMRYTGTPMEEIKKIADETARNYVKGNVVQGFGTGALFGGAMEGMRGIPALRNIQDIDPTVKKAIEQTETAKKNIEELANQIPRTPDEVRADMAADIQQRIDRGEKISEDDYALLDNYENSIPQTRPELETTNVQRPMIEQKNNNDAEMARRYGWSDAANRIIPEDSYARTEEFTTLSRQKSDLSKQLEELRNTKKTLEEELKSEVTFKPRDQWTQNDEVDALLGKKPATYTDRGNEILAQLEENRSAINDLEAQYNIVNDDISYRMANERLSQLSKYQANDITPATQQDYSGFSMTPGEGDIQTALKNGDAIIAEMSPQEYIERCAYQIFGENGYSTLESTLNARTQKRVGELVNEIQKGEKLNTPYLDFTKRRQEGLHRALAAYELGIEKIPVVVKGTPESNEALGFSARNLISEIDLDRLERKTKNIGDIDNFVPDDRMGMVTRSPEELAGNDLDPAHDLAWRYAEAYSDLDHYDYMDMGEGEIEGLVEQMADDIAKGNDLTSYIDMLEDSIDDAPDVATEQRMTGLVEELRAIQEGRITQQNVNRPINDTVTNADVNSTSNIDENVARHNTDEDAIDTTPAGMVQSKTYNSMKNSPMFQTADAQARIAYARDSGEFDRYVHSRTVSKEKALTEFVNNHDRLESDLFSGRLKAEGDLGVDKGFAYLNDVMSKPNSAAAINRAIGAVSELGTEGGRIMRAYRDYASTRERSLVDAGKYIREASDIQKARNKKSVESDIKTISEDIVRDDELVATFGEGVADARAIVGREGNATKAQAATAKTLADKKLASKDTKTAKGRIEKAYNRLSEKFGMDDDAIQNIRDAVADGATANEVARMIRAYQAIGKTGISSDAINKVNALYDQAEQLPLHSKKRYDLEIEALTTLVKDVGGNRSIWEMLNSFRYLAMLMNTGTHIRNKLSNSIQFVQTKTKDTLAAILEPIFIKDRDQRTKAILNNFSPKDRELVEASNLDATEGVYSRLNDQGKYNDFESAMRFLRSPFNNIEPLNKLERFNTAALNGEDWDALQANYKWSLAGFLKARGYDASIFNSTDPKAMRTLEEGRAYAIDQAKRATFHEESETANTISRLTHELLYAKDEDMAKRAVKKILGVSVEGMLPFKKVPVNVAKQGVRYSPLGWASTAGKVVSKASAAKVIDSFATSSVGTMLFALGYVMRKKGYLTAAEEGDSQAANAQREQGKQQFAINIPGLGTYTMDWAAPPSISVFAGAQLAQLEENMKKKQQRDAVENADLTEEEREKKEREETIESANNVINAISQIGQPLFEMSFMKSFQDTLESLSYSVSNNESMIPNAIGTGAASMVSQFVPTMLGQIARTIDPYRRSTYSDKTGITKQLERGAKKVWNKIPGLSTFNEPYITSEGEMQYNTGGDSMLSRAAFNFLSPGYFSPEKINRTDEELNRLYDNGFNAYMNIEKKGKIYDTKLTPEQLTEYQIKYGTQNKDMYDMLMKRSEYNGLSDTQKESILNGLKAISKQATAYSMGLKDDFSENEQKLINAVNSGNYVPALNYKLYGSMLKDAGLQNNEKNREKLEKQGSSFLTETQKKNDVLTKGGVEVTQDNRDYIDEYGQSALPAIRELEDAGVNVGKNAINAYNDGVTTEELLYMQENDLGYERYANAKKLVPSLTPQNYYKTYKDITKDGKGDATIDDMLNYLNSHSNINSDEIINLYATQKGQYVKEGNTWVYNKPKR